LMCYDFFKRSIRVSTFDPVELRLYLRVRAFSCSRMTRNGLIRILTSDEKQLGSHLTEPPSRVMISTQTTRAAKLHKTPNAIVPQPPFHPDSGIGGAVRLLVHRSLELMATYATNIFARDAGSSDRRPDHTTDDDDTGETGSHNHGAERVMGHENFASTNLLTPDYSSAGGTEPNSQANHESPTQATIDGVRVFRPNQGRSPPTLPGDEGVYDNDVYIHRLKLTKSCNPSFQNYIIRLCRCISARSQCQAVKSPHGGCTVNLTKLTYDPRKSTKTIRMLPIGRVEIYAGGFQAFQEHAYDNDQPIQSGTIVRATNS
jgi:hypothetical protein